MKQTRTIEECKLADTESILARNASVSQNPAEARFQILEAAASKVGGFSLQPYHTLQKVERDSRVDIDKVGVAIVAAIAQTGIPAPLALSALARPIQHEIEQKRTGSWNTDWRLARFLASTIETHHNGNLLDPACGTGSLLVASVLHLAGPNQELRAGLLAKTVCGTDLDPAALRGAALALSSLTSDIGAIADLLPRLRAADALVAPEKTWADRTVNGRVRFDVVIGNPPWERLRVTRHEHLAAAGVKTHYGDEMPDDGDRALVNLSAERASVASYVNELKGEYALQGTGETDLYKLFTELAVSLLADRGQLAWLLPGGIIRSQGTSELRTWLIERCSDLRFTILSNRARFFSVYRRQKFVVVDAKVGEGIRHPIHLRHAEGTHNGIEAEGAIPIGRGALKSLREDRAIPEVRTQAEWSLYSHLARSGARLSDWRPVFLREVDMSLDQRWFQSRSSVGALPLIEGRMVHQYRHDAKRYLSGTGRAARWEAQPNGASCAPRPQHWFPTAQLSSSARARTLISRVAFCDITGQTNERGMLAARIPAGFVCGNKVPTVVFDGDTHTTLLADAFLAIANSFVFDWLLRRMISTSVNFFLLRDLPWPLLEADGLPMRRLADLARRLSVCTHQLYEKEQPRSSAANAELRAQVEVLVADVWDLDLTAMRLVFSDFPLLDGACSPIRGESRSTVTRDLVLLRIAERRCERSDVIAELQARIEEANQVGATPFVPTQFGNLEETQGLAL